MSNHYLSLQELKSASFRRAGSKGALVRWANHEKVKTKLLRIHEDDYNFFSLISCHYGTIIDAVHHAVCHCRRCRLFRSSSSVRDC